jgi:hypothetical protein
MGGYGYTKAIRFDAFNGVPGEAAASTADNIITSAGWYHIAGVFDQNGSPQSKHYVNGVLAAQSVSSISYLPNAIAMRIGAMHDQEYYGGTQSWKPTMNPMG